MSFFFHDQPDKFRANPKLSDEQNEKQKAEQGEKFVKVSAAYNVLSDDKKRKVYDKYGQNGLDAMERGIDPEEAGFGNSGGGGGFGSGGFGGAPGGGGGSFHTAFTGADAFKVFEQMVSVYLCGSSCFDVLATYVSQFFLRFFAYLLLVWRNGR
jgi:curved DNA-binding protein CbpA